MNNYTKKITILCAKYNHEANLKSCVVCDKGVDENGTRYYC